MGGNINLNPRFIVLKDSRIIAKADKGKGGNIDIETTAYLKDAVSEVDASSKKGIHGTVDIHAAFNYLGENIAPLPGDFRSAVKMLREPCIARLQGGKYSSLVAEGHDAFPVEPCGLMPSPLFLK